jgi:hypothetical protein
MTPDQLVTLAAALAVREDAIEILELAIELAEAGSIIPLRHARIELGKQGTEAAELAESTFKSHRAQLTDRKPSNAEIAEMFRAAIVDLRQPIPAAGSAVTPRE